MRCLATITALPLILATLAACTTQTGGAPPTGAAEITRGCPLINVGTPENPKRIPDPGCDSPAD
jgi:hypothetical protein